MKIIALAIVTTLLTVAQAEILERDLVKLEELTIKNIQGETRISASMDGTSHLRLNKVAFSESCELKIDQKGDNLEIKVEKRGWLTSGKDCQLNIEAKVATLRSLTISQVSGLVDIKNISAANIEVDAVSATTNIDADTSKVIAKSISGAISIRSPAAKDIFMKSVSGGLELDAESGKPVIEMVTVSGSALFKTSQAPEVTFKSVSGRLNSKAISGNGSGAPVSFTSVSGSLTIQ